MECQRFAEMNKEGSVPAGEFRSLHKLHIATSHSVAHFFELQAEDSVRTKPLVLNRRVVLPAWSTITLFSL